MIYFFETKKPNAPPRVRETLTADALSEMIEALHLLVLKRPDAALLVKQLIDRLNLN